jgi:hypothetical protein
MEEFYIKKAAIGSGNTYTLLLLNRFDVLPSPPPARGYRFDVNPEASPIWVNHLKLIGID